MLDTVEFHLYDLDKHSDIVQKIDPRVTRHGVTRKLVQSEQEDEIDLFSRLRMKPVVEMHDLGQELYIASWTKLQSNHKDVAVMIDWKNSCLRFNFSIPKWLYGNNIQQFIPNQWDSEFNGFDSRALKIYATNMYRPLQKFQRIFFDKTFPNCYVDFDCLYIPRIDFCFNQVFLSKKDALEYLAYQKRMVRKYSKDIVKEKRAYEFGITFVAPGYYSEKIYHKGSEYKSKIGDRGWHVEKNRIAGKMIYDVDSLQLMADKILRYEFTYHSRGLDYFFKDRLFRKNDRNWQNLKKDVKLLSHYRNEKGELYNSQRDSKAYRGLRKRDENGNRTGDFVAVQNLSNHMKQKIKYYRLVEGRKIRFFLGNKSTVEDEQYFMLWDNDLDPKGIITSKKLSNRFMEVLGMRFLLMIQMYKPKGLTNYSNLIEKLRDLKKGQTYAKQYYMNRDVYVNHISERQLRIVLELMSAASLVELKDTNVISKRTYYRLVKLFKDCGYNENSRFEHTIENNYDFTDYHEWILKNRTNLYFGNFHIY